jgi:hypothetical protein
MAVDGEGLAGANQSRVLNTDARKKMHRARIGAEIYACN